MDAEVGRRVHMLMWSTKLTQTDFAPRIGLTQAGLSKKLRGERGWSVGELVSVAAALGTTVAYLVGETLDITGPDSEPVGRTGLEPVTDGLWVAPVTPITASRKRAS